MVTAGRRTETTAEKGEQGGEKEKSEATEREVVYVSESGYTSSCEYESRGEKKKGRFNRKAQTCTDTQLAVVERERREEKEVQKQEKREKQG